MPDTALTIQRLVLQVPGVNRNEGQQMADLVVKRMERMVGSSLRSGTLGSLRVRVQAEPGMTPNQLADRIAETIVGALR